MEAYSAIFARTDRFGARRSRHQLSIGHPAWQRTVQRFGVGNPSLRSHWWSGERPGCYISCINVSCFYHGVRTEKCEYLFIDKLRPQDLPSQHLYFHFRQSTFPNGQVWGDAVLAVI